MQNGLNRKLLLLAVFLSAFLAVIIIRKVQNGESILEIISGNTPTEQGKNKNYTLQKKPSLDKKDIKTLIAFDRECATLVHAVIPSVVSINTNGIRNERRYDVWGRTWLQPRAVQSQGSGVIVTKEGHVLTNYHVIKGNPQIKITMHDGSVHPAKMQRIQTNIEKLFGYAEIQLLDFDDLYAGKICAALDRQHPRDLFDCKLLLENGRLCRMTYQTIGPHAW